MNVLLDTRVALWALESEGALALEARDAILAADTVVLSVVSPWELVIKAALGRITLHRPVQELVQELQRALGAVVLPVQLRHVLEVEALPPHHGDPFDRLLIGQARSEGLAVVTRDALFSAYDVEIVRA